jgi:hypothetical protein
VATEKKPTKKQRAHALITRWLNNYETKYGFKPARFNRFALTYGFEALIDDYPGEAEEIIDYYFKVWVVHDPSWFIYHYGEVAEVKWDEEEDAKRRAELRVLTIERMKNVASSKSDQGGTTEQ